LDTPLSENEIERLNRKTFERAINLLTYRARTVEEMRERLLEKPWARATIVAQVIEKLLAYGYLNDSEFAREFAHSRLRQKPVGRRVLQQKLNQKKLDRTLVEQALEECFAERPEAELIEEALTRRIRIRGVPKSKEDRKKLFDFLMRQGFSASLVIDKLKSLKSEEQETVLD
jgi:regulatory protein